MGQKNRWHIVIMARVITTFRQVIREEKIMKLSNKIKLPKPLFLIIMTLFAIVVSLQTTVASGSGIFIDSGQNLGNTSSWKLALGDLDNDNDLDAFVPNSGGSVNQVWLNGENGNSIGIFSDNGQNNLGPGDSAMVALGDLDNDGDLDAFIASGLPTRSNKVWLNNGIGNFSDSGQTLGTSNSIGLALGDVDGDGDLDAFVANHGAANVGHGNKVWLNDGNGNFSDNGQSLGSSFSAAVALGDLDGDGDLDAFVANGFGGNHPGKVWLNDGNGNFNDSGQNLGSSNSFEVALGDLDEDGDLDAFVANGDNQSNKVWLNDGNGNFNNSGQALGNSSSWGLALGDLDGDSDLDAFVGNFLQGDKVWLNENQPNPSGSITLIKQANQDATFYFSGDLGDFSLPTAGSKQFTNLSSGSYTITEATTQDWVLISVQCTAAGANTFDYGFDFSAQSVTIQLMPNQDVTCTLINEKPNFEPASCRLYLPLIFNTDKRVPKSE